MEVLAIAAFAGLVAGAIGYWLETKHGAALDRAAEWMTRH